jgi:hypothetical protein
MDKPLADLPVPQYTQKISIEPSKTTPKSSVKTRYLDNILNPVKLKKYFASKK